ncbi:MAG: hypothetical protein AVDCRST_MAG56-5500 [uncultured Cytophagales bacterium]|uniref:Uncharacterized protein n=1 Tax=uncultured Cytophagales bacterium TaxID=158755 RepID=A0A6J4KEM6_9SPHI|nr:MAG: hypothetical protein AVDCRST_MAG56-5500 [uncultured Cytophagales bacterium]
MEILSAGTVLCVPTQRTVRAVAQVGVGTPNTLAGWDAALKFFRKILLHKHL